VVFWATLRIHISPLFVRLIVWAEKETTVQLCVDKSFSAERP
jgi:hypothetical protein